MVASTEVGSICFLSNTTLFELKHHTLLALLRAIELNDLAVWLFGKYYTFFDKLGWALRVSRATKGHDRGCFKGIWSTWTIVLAILPWKLGYTNKIYASFGAFPFLFSCLDDLAYATASWEISGTFLTNRLNGSHEYYRCLSYREYLSLSLGPGGNKRLRLLLSLWLLNYSCLVGVLSKSIYLWLVS